MANASNVYATAQPLQGTASDFINNQEELGFKRRQEQRFDDEINERKLAKQQAIRDKQRERYTSQKGIAPSGIKNIDSAYVTLMNQVMDKRTDLYEKELSGQQLTPEEVVLYAKLDKAPETIALMTKSFIDADKAYTKAVADGDIKRDLQYESDRERLVDGAVPFIDDEGNPVFGFDKDGDGNPEMVSFDFTEGVSMKPRIIENIGYDKILEGAVKTLEPTVNTTDSNFNKVKVTGLDPVEAKTRAERIVYDANGNPSKTAISYFFDAGVEPENITPEMLTKFNNKVAQDLMLSVKRGREQDRDYSASLAERREVRMARKEDEDKPTIGTPVEPSREAWGRSYDTLNTKSKLSVPVTGNPVKLPAVDVNTGIKGKDGKSQRINLSDAILENYTYNKNGNLVIDVSYPGERVVTKNEETGETTTTKENRKYQVAVTPETESRIAKRLGLSVKELKASADNPNAEKETAAQRALRIANGG